MISTPKDQQQVDHQQPLESSTELSSHTQTRLVAALIILATLNALIWSFVRVPALGGPDEFDHFKIVQNIVTSGSLAVFEGYGPGAYASGPIRAQVAHEITPNAFAIPVAAVISLIGSTEYPFNLHVARLFTVGLYPMTLWLAYLTLRRIFADVPVAPIWGVAVMATVPMFTLVHSYYTNDTPAIAASTFAIYATVRAWQSDFAPRDILLLGIALGVVALHKYTGFLIFPTIMAITLWKFLRDPGRLIRIAGSLIALTSAIAAWWYIRNWILYGDPIGVAVTQAAIDASGGAPIPPRVRGLNPIEFVQETNWIRENFATFWGGYGLEKMKLPGAAYLTLTVLIAAAASGLGIRMVRVWGRLNETNRLPLVFTMAFLHLGLWMLSFWSSYSVDVALSGRYVFPSFLPFIVLVISGLSALRAWKGRTAAWTLTTVPLMVAANATYFIQTLVPDVVASGHLS